MHYALKIPTFTGFFILYMVTLFDTSARQQLLPFTHTRPVADIRCGIWTMRERWEHFLLTKTGTLTATYLQELYPTTTGNLFVNGSVFATAGLTATIKTLQADTKLVSGNTVLAFNTAKALSFDEMDNVIAELNVVTYDGPVEVLNNIWAIFSQNDKAIREDFVSITKGRKSAPIPAHVTVSGAENLFIEEGANIYAGCIINADAGPVYIGKDTEVLEGTLIRGPLATGDHAVIKMGAKVYGATTIGPGCKVGGEINNAVFFANSNKAHDGYLGNAVIGEWCNLGADTNCSNLKNNYDGVKIWDEGQDKTINTGLTFCGLFMGDHSKCGINTMFNTGTVVGVSCNIYGAGYPKTAIPSFCWGGGDKMYTYDLTKAMATATKMMARRNKTLSESEVAMYRHIFENTRTKREIFVK